MISYPDYRTATNAAYKIIAERDHFSIATNVFAIAEQVYKSRVYTYAQVNRLLGTPMDDLLATSEYGFSIKDNKGNRIAYFNEKMPFACVRFTLAHEIGHAVLGHKDEEDPAAEKEANCFARNLLCPVSVALALCAETEDDYVSVFNISAQMAHVTIEWQSSDAYYIQGGYASIIREKIDAYNMGYESFVEFEKYVYA